MFLILLKNLLEDCPLRTALASEYIIYRDAKSAEQKGKIRGMLYTLVLLDGLSMEDYAVLTTWL